MARRPDLLAAAELTEDERRELAALRVTEEKDRVRAVDTVEQPHLKTRPEMRAGDTVRVHVKVREGEKELHSGTRAWSLASTAGVASDVHSSVRSRSARASSASSRFTAHHRQDRSRARRKVRRAKRISRARPQG